MSYLRLPHLSGDLLCFVAEDDLWVARLDGDGNGDRDGDGRARRLTVDRTKVGHPRFSPDGRHIAYTSWRSLVPEIHRVPVDGGPADRLTYWGSADTQVCGWSPDGDILAVASHGEPFSYFTWAYSVPAAGGPGGRLPWGPVSDIQVADIDGERRTLLLTGTPPHEPAAWKRYRGGATGRLWLHGERLLADLGGHLHSPMFVGDRIAFLSDHEGIGNLYSCAYDGSGLRRHTDHDAFYARHASSDGTRVVYQCAGDLWIVDDLAADSLPRRIDVRLGGPRAGRRTYQVPAAQHVDGISVDETGRASAVVVRGSLYWLTHRDGPARTITDTPGVRVRLPEMLGSGGQVAYVTDAEGEDAIEIAYLPRASGEREPRRLASGELGRVLELVSDPDGERLAIAAHDGRLLLIDATEDSDGEVTELIRSINGPVTDLAFSPDGAWLTWSHPGIGRSLRQIKMARIKDRLIVDVTNGRFEDENPVFTRDGRYLAFLSWRGFDPVYDVHTGDLSFPLGCRPYLVPLSSATPSPFALSPHGPAAGGLDPAEDEGAEGTDGTVTVEVEGLESRVTPFPVTASKYSALYPVAGGGLVWLRWPISGALGETFANPADTSGRPTLEYFNISKAKKSELVDHLDWFAVSGDATRLVVVDDDELRAVPSTDPGDSDTTVWIDLRRVLHEVDPPAEWRQSYEEAGRLIRAYFWDPHMCGIDWDAVLDQYRPLVERVASPDEFADLLREVLGELGTSHAYVTAARRNEGPPHYQRRQGLLGANFVRRNGGWTLDRILPGDSSDSKARSPLAGSGIREGATLTHVDGRPVDPVTGPFPLLAGAGGTTVELTFTPAEGGRAGGVQVGGALAGVAPTGGALAVDSRAGATLAEVGALSADSPTGVASAGVAPAEGALAGAAPAEGALAGDSPPGATPTGATPAGAAPAGAPPVGATPAEAALAGAAPAGTPPTGATPAGATPAEGAGAGAAPTGATQPEGAPAGVDPTEGALGGTVQLKGAPAGDAPTEVDPTQGALAEAAPAEGASAGDSPREAGPAGAAPAEAGPAGAAPAETGPAGAAPAEAGPAGAAPAEAGPAGAAPAEAGPAGAALTGNSPTGAAPAGATPAEAAPTGAVPTGAAPTGGPPAGTAPSAAASTADSPTGSVPAEVDDPVGGVPTDSSSSESDPEGSAPSESSPGAGGGRARRVAVVPLVDERPLRYQDWVAKRREVVRELSGGRCGYLHIPDMGGSGWAQFNRDLRMEVSRPALIVDVRGNAGGHISELVVEKLTRTILGWDLTRDAQPVSYASNAPRGPVVALADEATSSDGDMITAAFKLLELGPVVGQRTWGGVVGMTGRHRLGDGTVITVPMNAAWFDAYGWTVENQGVAPDLEVLRTPLDWAEGRHVEMDEAIRLALDLLTTHPAATPPTYSHVPNRARPKLPPRS